MYTLTTKETDVLRLISHGSDTKEIAKALHYSPETIKSRLRSIRDKLEVRTTTEACCEAIRRNLIL